MSNIYNRDALKDNVLENSDYQKKYYETIISAFPTIRLAQAAAIGTEGQLIGVEHIVPSANEVDTIIGNSKRFYDYEQIQKMFSDDPSMVSINMAIPSKNFVKDFQNIMDEIKKLTGADPVIGIENGFKSKSPAAQAITVKLMSPNGQAYQIKFTTPTNVLAMDAYSKSADHWLERYNLGTKGDDPEKSDRIYGSLNPIEKSEIENIQRKYNVSKATAIDLYIIDKNEDANLKMISRPKGFEQIIDVPERDVDMVRDECKRFDTKIKEFGEGYFEGTSGSCEISLDEEGIIQATISSQFGEFESRANVITGEFEYDLNYEKENLARVESDVDGYIVSEEYERV